jgi:hypothetical protein
MPESQNLITSGDVVISAEWSEHKQHWIVRRNGEKWLYCHNHCGHKADWLCVIAFTAKSVKYPQPLAMKLSRPFLTPLSTAL